MRAPLVSLLAVFALLVGAATVEAAAAHEREGIYAGTARWPRGEGRIIFAVWDRSVRQGHVEGAFRCGWGQFDARVRLLSLRFDRDLRRRMALPRAGLRRNGFNRRATAVPEFWMERTPGFSGRFVRRGARGRISRQGFTSLWTQDLRSLVCDSQGPASWHARRIRNPWRDGLYRGTIRRRLYGGRTVLRPISFVVLRGRVSRIEYRHTEECYSSASAVGAGPPLYSRTRTTSVSGPRWLMLRNLFSRPRGRFSADVFGLRRSPLGGYPQLSIELSVRGSRATGTQYGWQDDQGRYCDAGRNAVSARWIRSSG